MMLSEVQKIGLGLLAFGTIFIVFGIMLLFDTGLMVIGNFMLVSGGIMFFGLDKARDFFIQKQRWKGTACFTTGIILILLKYPKIGFIVEVFGFVNLFADLFPFFAQLGANIPIVKDILQIPVIAKLLRTSTPPPV